MEMSGINPSVQMNRYFNAEERLGLEETIAGLNSDLTANNKRVAKTEMGKDDFLLILVKQLANQDPTAPVEDKQFIAQMAQFSTLEQMTNMANGFTRLSECISIGGFAWERGYGYRRRFDGHRSCGRGERPRISAAENQRLLLRF